MAAALDPDDVLRSSEGRDNFQRLARLLMSGGTVLLREAFEIKCPPSNLPTILQNPATKKLLEKPKLTKPQRDCLYPSPGMYGKSTDFDITLLFRLLRTICGLAPPVTGWDTLPASKDDSLEADLARIKYYRNSIYGHVTENMEISDDEFSVLWREISEALVRIAGQISPAKAKEWKNAIDTFLKDPLTEEDKRHEQELQRWYQNDTEVKEYLEKVESSMKHLEKEAYYSRQEVRDEAQDIKDQLGGKVESTAQEVKRLGQEVRDEAQDIKDELGGKVESTAQEVQSLRKELRVEAQSIKDLLELGGRHNSSAGGQLFYFFCVYLLLVKYFTSNILRDLHKVSGLPVRCTLCAYFDRSGFVYFLKRKNVNDSTLFDSSRMTTHSSCLFCLCCKWLVTAINDTLTFYS